jgi:FKBP-type peptidyl-prolyl cis-trans isomerase 2
LLLVAATFIVMYIKENKWEDWTDPDHDKTPTEYVADGDIVTVEYKGWLADNGLIFDTNIQSVGENDTLYPKTPGFDENKQYSPLKFTVGGSTMIKGFDRGVVGMKKGETRTITVPPELGYGKADPTLIFNISLAQTVPVFESMSRADFAANYSAENAVLGAPFSHRFWGWPCQIVSLDNYTVVIQNMPEYGANYKGFDWNTTITDISTSNNVISLKHLATTDDSGKVITPARFRMLDADLPADVFDNGIITIQNNQVSVDFNKEVVGRTLIFQVTVTEISK